METVSGRRVSWTSTIDLHSRTSLARVNDDLTRSSAGRSNRCCTALQTIILCIVGFLAVSSTALARNVAIVLNGRPMATIVVARGASSQVVGAANTLASYIRRSSGANMRVITDSRLTSSYGGLTIQVGKTAITGSAILPASLDSDGFIISTRPYTILICGPTDWGTKFGVYDFLERYVGVRWLMPGSNGDDVPRKRTISIPVGMIQDQPVFFSRLFSGLPTDCQREWATFNRMHGRVSFHHNMNILFPPSKYAATHPEFYPILNGTRFIPSSDKDDVNWEPCFSAPGIVDEAVKTIVQYFKDYPEETSYSLGINDSAAFCTCPLCLAKITGAKNYLGFVDYSSLYYDWCNKVVEGVRKAYPDKWFGCLAYMNVGSPPTTVQLNPHLIPYITYDRMAWMDASTQSIGYANNAAWEAAASTLGWYDYIYGTPYCLPRVYFHESADYLRYGAQHGVRTHYAELYPNWGEGPKPYVFLKLWWNPNQNVDALLNEWYTRCVGPDAAPYLAEYYAIWERFWTNGILQSRWFIPETFLNFGDPRYLADVKREDIERSHTLLDTVIAKCRTNKQRARAQLLEKAFQYYESSALAYLNDVPKTAAIGSEADALDLINTSETAMYMAQRRLDLVQNVYPYDPVLVQPMGIDIFAGSGIGWGSSGIWRIMDWVNAGNPAVRQRMIDMANNAQAEIARDEARLILSIADGQNTPITTNHSFESGSGGSATNWAYWVVQQGHMYRTQSVAHTGTTSLVCDSMDRGGPFQGVSGLAPGKYCIVGWVYVDTSTITDGTVGVVLANDDGSVRYIYSEFPNPVPGVWMPISMVGSLPSGRVSGHIVAIVNGFQYNNCKVYLDDVALYRVP